MSLIKAFDGIFGAATDNAVRQYQRDNGLDVDGVIGSAALIQSVDWLTVLSAASLAAVVSLLMSWATGLPEADGRKE